MAGCCQASQAMAAARDSAQQGEPCVPTLGYTSAPIAANTYALVLRKVDLSFMEVEWFLYSSAVPSPRSSTSLSFSLPDTKQHPSRPTPHSFSPSHAMPSQHTWIGQKRNGADCLGHFSLTVSMHRDMPATSLNLMCCDPNWERRRAPDLDLRCSIG